FSCSRTPAYHQLPLPCEPTTVDGRIGRLSNRPMNTAPYFPPPPDPLPRTRERGSLGEAGQNSSVCGAPLAHGDCQDDIMGERPVREAPTGSASPLTELSSPPTSSSVRWRSLASMRVMMVRPLVRFCTGIS